MNNIYDIKTKKKLSETEDNMAIAVTWRFYSDIDATIRQYITTGADMYNILPPPILAVMVRSIGLIVDSQPDKKLLLEKMIKIMSFYVK